VWDCALKESGFQAPRGSDGIEAATNRQQPWLAGRFLGIVPEYEQATEEELFKGSSRIGTGTGVAIKRLLSVE
jgi:hypothetical protein